MSSSTAATAPLTFDAFWRWLKEHRNCLLRVGTGDLVLMDHELAHWNFVDEDDGRAVVEFIIGKALVGEVLIERSEVVFVQASPDLESPGSQVWNFECIGGGKGENYPLFSFLLSHGMEGAPGAGHTALKH